MSEKNREVVGTLIHLTWEEAAFKIMAGLDQDVGRECKWTEKQVHLLFINLRLLDMNYPMTSGLVATIVSGDASEELEKSSPYQRISKILNDLANEEDA